MIPELFPPFVCIVGVGVDVVVVVVGAFLFVNYISFDSTRETAH